MRTGPHARSVRRHRCGSRWRRWFASPRWAGGLATGLVAALGVGLWLDLGTQPTIERPATASDTTPFTPGSADAEAARDAQAAVPAPSAEPARRARAVERNDSRKNDGSVAAKTARDNGASRALGARAPSSIAQARVEPPVRESADAAPPAVPAAPAVKAAAAAGIVAPKAEQTPILRADAQAAPTSARRRSAQDALAKLAVPPAVEQASPSGLASNLTAGAAGAAGTAGAAGVAAAAASAAASPALTLLRRARAELAAGSARWVWQAPGAAAPTALDDAALAWLLMVVQTARGQWVEASERDGAGDALEVRWWRDGSPQATLRIEADGLRWIEPSGRIRCAPLDAAALRRLRAF
jgi:hypothetical protein